MRKTALSILTTVLVLLSLQSWGVSPQDSYVWTKREAAGPGVAKSWSSIAMSSDGMNLAACVQIADFVYTSSDGGATWAKRTPAGAASPKYWHAVAMSSDGSKIAAGADYIYVGTYGGTVWTKRSPAGATVKSWSSIAMSTDGKRIAACSLNDFIYISTDSGATWKKCTVGAGEAKDWVSVAMSPDGKYLVAGAQIADAGGADYAYYSTDSGATWTKLEPDGAGVPTLWASVALSSNGAKIALCTEDDFFVFTSEDSGTTWSKRDPSAGLYSWGSAVAMNSDGSKMMAGSISSDIIFNSSDFGASWNESYPNGAGEFRNWVSITMSGDGAKVAACASNSDYVYTGYNYKEVKFTAGANGTIVGDADQLVPEGTDCAPVTADPDDYYHFVDWTGDLASTDNPLEVTSVLNDMNITANFAHDQGTITTEAIGNGTIDVAIGPYDTMTLYDISATAGGGYTFVNFSVFGNATLEATTSPTQFKLTGLDGCSAKITANFLDDLNIRTPALNTPESVPGISGLAESSMVYKVTVPAGTTRMIINTAGGAVGEDCDIYISPDAIPTLEEYYARSTGPTTLESITVLNPEAGKDWYILLYGYKNYNGVDLNISMLNDVPEKPVLTSASQGDAGKVTLLWSDCSGSGAVSYDIFRSKDNIPGLAEFVKNVDLGATVTADDTTAVLGTHYYYWIRARSGAGDDKSSDFSNSEQGWIADGTVVKNLSSGVSVTGIKGAVGTTRIFTFTVPVTNPVVKLLEIKTSGGTGDCDISISKGGDILVYGVKATNNEIIRIADPATGEYVISLYANTEFSGLALRAKHYNAKPPPPASPLASDGTYADAVFVSWTASDGAASYEVWRATSNVSSLAQKIADVSDASYVDSSNTGNLLVNTGTYFYWIKALNGAGTSAFSASNSGYISKTPAAPGSVAASDGTYFDKIKVTWPKVAGATYYRIYRNTSGTFNESDLIGEVPYMSSTITYSYDDVGAADPKPGTKYWYYVKSANANGVSSGYKSGSGYIRFAGPAGVTASDGTYFNKVKITWTALAGATEYEVYSFTSNDANNASSIGTSASPEYYDGSASGKTFYWIKAKYAYPGPGSYTSDFSASNSGYPKDVITTVAAPTLKSVSNGASEKVSIAWSEVPTATKYIVYRKVLAGDPWVAITLAIPGFSVEDDPPLALQKYMYCVKAMNHITGTESSLSASKTGYKTDVNTDFAAVAPVAVVSGILNSQKIYYIDVPPGTRRLVAQVENGDGGDCDLYAKFGSCPTKASYNAKGSEISGAAKKEILTVANPADGRWYLLLYGATAYNGVQFSVNCYSATDIVFSLVPANDQTVPFTAQFKGMVLDETGTGIAGLTVGVRDPLTGLTTWLPKTDAKGNFTYSTKIAADGEYTYDFYLSTIPDSTLSIGSWTVKTKRNPWESGNFFDFSGYLAGTRIPVADIEAQGGTLAGLEEYMNARRGFEDGPIDTDYENIWVADTLAAASSDPKITSKLDPGLYMLFYGTEGAAVGNGPADAPPGLVANPLLLRVSPARQAAVIANLKANGLIDNAVADNVTENGGIGVVVVTAFGNPDETGSDLDYDISLYADEQLELLANIAGNIDVEPDVTPEKKYVATVAARVIISIDGATRRISAAVSSFMK
ncbi:MAG TPA: hypothetical protein DET40_23125 [Lentisphaeria bacterium]|nr:MAG: hypothetical protein A2X45_20715 [Lentisphaerae bacterium GWF2_50_93]HCE46447.1 hypothetical protein [Lentisphaeria bacterium]